MVPFFAWGEQMFCAWYVDGLSIWAGRGFGGVGTACARLVVASRIAARVRVFVNGFFLTCCIVWCRWGVCKHLFVLDVVWVGFCLLASMLFNGIVSGFFLWFTVIFLVGAVL